MRKFLIILLLVCGIGSYLHFVRGVEFEGLDVKELTENFYRDALQVLPKKEVPILTGTRWEEREPMPTSRGEIGAVVIAGKIYVVGGLDGYGRTLRLLEIYDIETDTWSKGPSMPQALHHPAVTTDGEKLYVIGGLVGITFKPVDMTYVYHPVEARWEELGHLNDFRGAATAGFVDGRLMVVGGRDLAGPTGTSEFYNFENGRWNSFVTMPTPREHLASATIGSHIFVGAGRTHAPDGNLATVEMLDLSLQKPAWKKTEDMPTARSGFAMTSMGNRLFVFGGEGPEGTIPQVEEYDAGIGKWLPFGHMPTPRHGLVAVTFENRIYVIGGGKRSGYSVSNFNEVLIIE